MNFNLAGLYVNDNMSEDRYENAPLHRGNWPGGLHAEDAYQIGPAYTYMQRKIAAW